MPEIEEFIVYEDEGFSGGNMNRPKFKKLLADAKSKKFNVLICYRLDRISRNVADFSSTLEMLQHNNIAFISIKEQFDTSTPMGKAMVYIASVFAQLERETIAERIRDNMLELAKTGRWLGGQCPLGFESEQVVYIDDECKERTLHKLSPIEDELRIVKLIYDKYYETSSIHKVLKHLLAANIKGKNGGDFAPMSISDILKNPVYVESDQKVFDYLKEKGMKVFGEANGNGILVYNKKSSKSIDRDISDWIATPSKHKGIISSSKWLYVQHILEKNSKKSSLRQGTSKKSLLSGILKCARCGAPMRIVYGRSKKDGSDKIYYYMCTMKAHSGKTRCDNPNIRGDLLENQIIKQMLGMNIDIIIKEIIQYSLQSKKASPPEIIKNINLDIEEKIKEMNSLLTQISKLESSTAQEFMLKKIDSLGKEINSLKLELEDLEKKKYENTLNDLNTSIMLQALKEFQQFFKSVENLRNDEDSIKKKRYLLERAIDKITVDGETKDVNIDLWGAKNI